MLKVKCFFTQLNATVNNWLQKHPNIKIVSTNLCEGHSGITYCILYEQEDKHNGSNDMARPVQFHVQSSERYKEDGDD